MDASERRGALSSTASATLAEAARAAKDQRIPLVASIASSGADIIEGMAALHGWGQAARAIADCSGHRARDHGAWTVPRSPARRSSSAWPTSWS